MNKEIKVIFAALVVVMVLSGCDNLATKNDTNEPVNTQTEGPQTKDEIMLSLSNAAPESPEGISDVQLGFNLALLKKLGEAQEGNLFYSSMSINAAMTMAYFGADGETRQEIANTLGYGDMDITDVAAYQKYLLQSYEDSGDTTFNTANSIWIDDMFEAKQSYINTMVDVFDTQVTNLDLQSNSAIDELNSWIDKSTEGMIQKLFEEEDNSLESVSMVLMNAIYFNGDWATPFDPSKTFDTKFGGSTGTSDIRMMSSSENVLGNEEEDYVSVLLPYGDDERFAMVAVLPNDMESFAKSLTEESLKNILTTFKQQEDPIVHLPVFELEQKVKLNDVLIAMGIEQAFSNRADFSLMSEDALMIDKVLHKAKIKVDEEGTEAAAVTSVGMVLSGAMPMDDRFEFIADKPFLFFVIDTENDLVLFTGKVMDLK